MRRSSLLLLLAAGMTVIQGCSLLQGSSETAGLAGSQLETPRINVAVLPTVETAPLQYAIKNGYFREEGLEINVTIAGSGQQTVEGMVNGQYDVVYSTYPPLILAQVKGVADIKLVAGNSYAAPRTAMLMKSKASSLRTAADLSGKKVAVTAKGTLAELMVRSAAATQNVDHSKIQFAEMPFPAMPTALERGQVDAAMLVEPFVTSAEQEVGALPLLDLASGPLNDLPFTAFGATAGFVRSHPKTVKAFQRGLTRGANESLDRTKIEPLLPEFAKIDSKVAALTQLPVFRTSLDPVAIQRVPRLMAEFGLLAKEVDVSGMLLKLPPTDR